MTDVFDRIFGRQTVRTLTAKDFKLDYDPPVQLSYNDCILVLFHGSNQESINLATVFAYAAASVVGPVFAHVDIEREKEVAEAFMRLHNSPGAYNRFTLEGYPTIIAYQNTKPVGFYNGERDAQAIVDYAYTLACRPGYFEPEQLFKSVHLDQSIEMGGFVQSPTYNSSTQFTATAPLNRYDPRTGVVATGSQAALAAGQEETGTAQGVLPQTSGPVGIAPSGTVGIPTNQLRAGQLVPTTGPSTTRAAPTTQPATVQTNVPTSASAPVPTTSALGTPVAIR